LAVVVVMPFGADEGNEKPCITCPYGLKASYVRGKTGIVKDACDDISELEAISGGANGYPYILSRLSPPSILY
jgi:hypothetical protein